MRYAILSDIHSNLEALSAVLEFLAMQRIDRYVCLGDLVGYGADPELCLARLQGIEALCVAGNHDLACVGKFELRRMNSFAREAVIWTRDRLGFAELDSLRQLPLTRTEEPLTMVHGTLRDPERFTYLVDAAEAVDTIKLCRTPYCLVGHTHLPMVVEYDLHRQRFSRLLTAADELRQVRLAEDQEKLRTLINPGSVGQPRDGDPRASCAVFDAEALTVSIHRIPYDVATAQRKILEAHLPTFLAERLALGR